MDMPSSAPAGGLIDRTVARLASGQAGSIHDQAKFLHHAGSPWFLALTALGVVFGDIGTSPLYAFQVALTGVGHPARPRPKFSGSSRSFFGH
jgi:KUP system potassium uptake protein